MLSFGKEEARASSDWERRTLDEQTNNINGGSGKYAMRGNLLVHHG